MAVALTGMDKSDDHKVAKIHGVTFRIRRNQGTNKGHHGIKPGPYWSVLRGQKGGNSVFSLLGHFDTLQDVRTFLDLIDQHPILITSPASYIRGLGSIYRRMPDRSYDRYESLY